MRPGTSSGRAVPIVTVGHRLARNGVDVRSLGPGESAVHEVTMSMVSGPSASVLARAEAVKPLKYSGESNHGLAAGNYWPITPTIRLGLTAAIEPHSVEAVVTHSRNKAHSVTHVLKLIFAVGSVDEELFPVTEHRTLNMHVSCRAPEST